MTDSKPSTSDILSKIRGKAAPASPARSVESESGAKLESKPSATADEAKVSSAEGSSAPLSVPASTADILAAARAEKAADPAVAPKLTAGILSAARTKGAPLGAGGSVLDQIRGKAAASAAKSSDDLPSSKSAAVDQAAVVPAGLTAADLVKAARAGKALVTAGASAPKLPSKTLAEARAASAKPVVRSGAEAASAGATRRGFMGTIVATVTSPVVIAWSSMVATLTASALATARFMMPNVLVEPPTKFKIGPPSDYAAGTVSTKWQAQFNIWVVNAEVDGARVIYALSTVCTHLGCTPNWLDGEQKFKCPCHGSGFYKSGVNFEGPAPRPLERVGIRLAEDGMLEVDKSVKFQRELGQWSNQASFVGVT